jgi:hypothetical protein
MNPTTPQTELTPPPHGGTPSPLLKADGQLAQVGWSRQPFRQRKEVHFRHGSFSAGFGKVAPVDRSEPCQGKLPDQCLGLRLRESLFNLGLI